MRVYVDSSAIIKRVVDESESESLEESLTRHVVDGDLLVSSSLTWIEVSRGIRRRLDDESPSVVADLVDDALSGVLESGMSTPVVALARRLGPTTLRSLDAIHLATAILLDADLVVAYDDRLLTAAEEQGLRTSRPT